MILTKIIQKGEKDMINDFVRQDEKDDTTAFVIKEIVTPIFDKDYQKKPIEQRWQEHKQKRSWFDSIVW